MFQPVCKRRRLCSCVQHTRKERVNGRWVSLCRSVEAQGQQCVPPFLCCAEVESSPQRPMSDSTQLDVAITPAKPGVVGKGESGVSRQFCVFFEVGAGLQRSLSAPGDVSVPDEVIWPSQQGCMDPDSMEVCSSLEAKGRL